MKKLRCLSVFVLLAFAVPAFAQSPKQGQFNEPEVKKVVRFIGKITWKAACAPAFVTQHLFGLSRSYRYGVAESLSNQRKKGERR